MTLKEYLRSIDIDQVRILAEKVDRPIGTLEQYRSGNSEPSPALALALWNACDGAFDLRSANTRPRNRALMEQLAEAANG